MFMARIFTTLFFAWALFVGPALCAGGLLEHACDCDHEALCQHEDACSDDPCAPLTAPQQRTVATSFEQQAPPLEVIRPDWKVTLEWQQRDSARGRAGNVPLREPPDEQALPYSDGEQPLLI